MPSLLAGKDKLMREALGIQRRDQLKGLSLKLDPLSDENSLSLIIGLYDRIPFVDGRAVTETCRESTLNDQASMVHNAFSQLVSPS